MQPSRSVLSALATLAGAAALALGAAGCSSDDSKKSSGTSDGVKSSPSDANEPGQTGKGKSKSKDKGGDSGKGSNHKPPLVRVPGRTPGIKASEPRYVGQYSTRVSKSRAAGLGAPRGTAGVWTLRLLRGAYNLFPGATVVGGPLRVSGARMTFRQRGGCDIPAPVKSQKQARGEKERKKAKKERKKAKKGRKKAVGRSLGPAGTYRWRLSGRSLTFRVVRDPCAYRGRQLSTLRWRLQL